MANSNLGKILIVEDDPDMENIYSEVLKSAGYSVDIAKDREEGYVKIIQGGYDLILLDIMMPKIDGLTVLKKLQEKTLEVYNGPIIVLSALNQPEIVKQAMSFGAKGYIVKSKINPDQLLSKVAQILQS